MSSKHFQLIVMPFLVLLVTGVFVVYADDLQCDYLYLRQANGSPIADPHIFKASNDYFGGSSFSDNPNGCRDKVIDEGIKDIIFKEEFEEKYGKMKGIWSLDIESDTWKLIKMRGTFSHWL